MKTNKDKQISVQQLKALHATFHRIGMDASMNSLPDVR